MWSERRTEGVGGKLAHPAVAHEATNAETAVSICASEMPHINASEKLR